jgi:hypothetical protein
VTELASLARVTWSVALVRQLVVSVSSDETERRARSARLTVCVGKGVGSLGSGIWGGLTGKGGKEEEAEE